MDAEPCAHNTETSRRSAVLPSTEYGEAGRCVQELQAVEGMLHPSGKVIALDTKDGLWLTYATSTILMLQKEN
jgi:hypothetical protein